MSLLPSWTVKSGYKFPSIEERSVVDLPLPLDFSNLDAGDDSTEITFTKISGNLPPGLRLEGSHIIGTPFEVARPTDFEFVIRASRGSLISDRTLIIPISGADNPVWVTPEGDLPIGTNQNYFILDSSFVDFQLSATDFDTATGQTLKYFISKGAGELPPGLILTETGRITGFIQPALIIKQTDDKGYYDQGPYDNTAYDFGYRSSNGYDSFVYDSVFFDFANASTTPRKLNRKYQFIVSVSDGDVKSQRRFNIYVVGDDFLRADNVITTAGNGVFTVDSTYLRSPLWLTAEDLGTRRANNYLTFLLDIFEGPGIVDPVFYNYETVNRSWVAEQTFDNLIRKTNTVTVTQTSSHGLKTGDKIKIISDLPNLTVDSVEVTVINSKKFRFQNRGKPYVGEWQPDTVYIFNQIVLRETKLYQCADGHTSSSNFNDDNDQLYWIEVANSVSDLGMFSKIYDLNERASYLGKDYICKIPHITGLGFQNVQWDLYGLPPGMNFDSRNGEIFGVVPYQSAITKNYKFTITATRYSSGTETASTSRTFSVKILGEIDTTMSWITDSDLGSLQAGYFSINKIEATSVAKNPIIKYSIIEGGLPPGLSLNLDGEIVGRVKQFPDSPFPFSALTTFDEGDFTLDGGTTTIDRVFKFTVLAQDQYLYSAITKEFYIEITTSNNKRYSYIFVKPFLSLDQRQSFNSFINNANIFPPNKIWRLNDPSFGVQKELRMLVYAGIETKTAAEYVSAIGLNHKKKRFIFGEVKKAFGLSSALDRDLSDDELKNSKTIFEVIYVEIIDPLEVNKKNLPLEILTKSVDTPPITVDNSSLHWYGEDRIDDLNRKEPYALRPNTRITIDQTNLLVSDNNPRKRYPNSLNNWQNRIKNMPNATTERNYLFSWMRTIQPGTKKELGYIKAVVLCYCKPGEGDFVLLNIKNSGFNFSNLDYTVDRYYIDSVLDDPTTAGKYIAFKDDKVTIT
jgi:hypothetical protein